MELRALQVVIEMELRALQEHGEKKEQGLGRRCRAWGGGRRYNIRGGCSQCCLETHDDSIESSDDSSTTITTICWIIAKGRANMVAVSRAVWSPLYCCSENRYLRVPVVVVGDSRTARLVVRIKRLHCQRRCENQTDVCDLIHEETENRVGPRGRTLVVSPG